MKPISRTRLFIRLSSQENQFLWLLQKDGSTVAEGDHTNFNPSDAAAVTCVMVPSTFILFREVHLARTTRKALEWALESFSLADPELFHLNLLRRENHVHYIAAVEHTRMRQWLALLDRYTIRPDNMLPDCLALAEGTSMTLGEELIARDKPWQGYCINTAHQTVISRLRKSPSPLHPQEGGFPALCAGQEVLHINLLTGPYRKPKYARVKRYLMPACLLALCFSLTLPAAYRGLSADFKARQNRQEASSLFSEAFGKHNDVPTGIRQSMEALRLTHNKHSLLVATNRHASLLSLLATDISTLTWSPATQQLTLGLNNPVTREFMDANNQQAVVLSHDGLTVIAGTQP